MRDIILKTIRNVRISEKASTLSLGNAYTFDVSTSANKKEIKKAVFSLYKVNPVKVNIINIPRKKIVSKGKIGVRGGGKKAMIFLKKEDKIEIV